jgi:hypothetical protein
MRCSWPGSSASFALGLDAFSARQIMLAVGIEKSTDTIIIIIKQGARAVVETRGVLGFRKDEERLARPGDTGWT